MPQTKASSDGVIPEMVDKITPLRGADLLVLLPAALTIYLAFNSGGFFPGATSLAAAEVTIAAAAMFVLSRRVLGGVSVPLAIAIAATGGLAAWTLLSAGWSDSSARALPEYTRALLYVSTLALFGLLPFDARRIRLMAYAFAVAIFTVCSFALVARTLPQVIFDPALLEEHRLGYPLTYWNALGLLAGVGILLCGHFACSSRDAPAVRVLGAAAVPLLTLTMYYTLSRGAVWATLGAVVVYLVLGRPRAVISGAIATAPPTYLILTVANPPDALVEGSLRGPTAVAAGHRVAAVLVACMLGAAILRALLLLPDRRLAGFRLSPRLRLPVLAGLVIVLASVGVAAALATGTPELVSAKYGEFTSSHDPPPGGGGSRLWSASTDGRKEHWEVALAAFHRDELRGSGAGTFSLRWARERSSTVSVEDAHSLYIETLGELGLVGFVLLVVALASILGAFAFRARGPDRPMFAALLAAGVAWATASGVDWNWEMPATTVWLFAFGGAALARSRGGGSGRSGPTRVVVGLTGVAVCGLLAWTPAHVAVAAGRFDQALDEFRRGDCAKAERAAWGALEAEPQRAAPYSLIAFCEIRAGRYRRALDAARAGRRRDPHNWETSYTLAVTRADLGLDPRDDMRRAARLNPEGELPSQAREAFARGGRRMWISTGRRAELPPPTAEDP